MKNKTMINFAACNIRQAEKHNGRDAEYIEKVNASPNSFYHIMSEYTSLNKTKIFSDYEGQSLTEIHSSIRTLVKQKTGRAMQEKDRIRRVKNKHTGEKYNKVIKGSSPIREGIVITDESTTLDDFVVLTDWLEKKGLHPIRIDIHNDEGHKDPRTGMIMYNRHAHVIVDWMDHNTGRSIKLGPADMSQMQDIVAEALGMERGRQKSETGAEHVRMLQWREMKAGEKLAEYDAELADINKSATENLLALAAHGQSIVSEYDAIQEVDATKATEHEAEARNNLETICGLPIDKKTDLLGRESEMLRLIRCCSDAIMRIGRENRALATRLPWLTQVFGTKQLAREAAMEAKVQNAIAEADRARAEFAKVQTMKKNLADRERVIRKMENEIEDVISQAKYESRQQALVEAEESHTRQLSEIMDRNKKLQNTNESLAKMLDTLTNKKNEMESKIRQLNVANIELTDKLRNAITSFKQSENDRLASNVNIHIALIRTFGAKVFEDKVLPFTSWKSWSLAKQKVAEMSRGMRR